MAETETQPKPEMPMFYSSIRPLDMERDGELYVSAPKDFNFAAKTNAIPLLVDEFPMAAAHYPIVFAAGPSPVPAAVVGLTNDQNLFLDDAGQWLGGSYLPAYVRRYPFLLMDDPDQKQYVLCIDENSEMLGKQGEYALFKDGKPTQFTQSAMNFCATLRQQGEATDEFVKALKDYNLLMNNDAQVDMPNGSKLQLAGFQVIDPKKFDLLPDSVYLSWRRKGWIGLIFAHLLSSHRWQSLIALSSMKG
ncbi:MAG: SapC family protein [Alphaproteobacteria bacterium]|nr:SapC family protein [Alphaproteobacteria bacterium]